MRLRCAARGLCTGGASPVHSGTPGPGNASRAGGECPGAGVCAGGRVRYFQKVAMKKLAAMRPRPMRKFQLPSTAMNGSVAPAM